MTYYGKNANKAEKTNSILPRIAGGDEKAIEDCLKAYGNLVWALARKYTAKSEDAEDAVQEIFLEIWQNAGRFDSSKAAESTFISLIARRRLIDRLRKAYRQPGFQSIEEVFEKPAGKFEEEASIKIEARKALAAMQALKPAQKNLMMMTIYEGMSHGEIAEKTGLPLGTVKTNIRRGFARVREVLDVKYPAAHQLRVA